MMDRKVDNKDIVKGLLLSGIIFLYLYKLQTGGFLNWSGLFESKWKILSFIVLTVSVVLAAVLMVLMKKNPDNKLIFAGSFAVLWFLYSFRAPEDVLTTYMWAEDGVILMKQVLSDGVKAIFLKEMGVFWVMQRAICYVSYLLVLLTQKFIFWPYLMSFISKTITVCCIAYFMRDKFAWLLEERYKRFLVCCVVAVASPYWAADVNSCDTSLPFTVLFACFLIGLNCFCSEEYVMPSAGETVFMVLVCLSSAAAPFVLAGVGLGFLRSFWDIIKNKRFDKKEISIILLKTGSVFVAALIQVGSILTSSRGDIVLNLINRLKYNVRDFMALPYFEMMRSWKVCLFGLAVWGILLLISNGKKLVVLYSGLYIFFFTLFCSVAYETEFFYNGEAGRNGRYMWLQSEIAFFVITYMFLFVETESLKIQQIYISEILLVALVLCVAVPTYYIDDQGSEYMYNYSRYSDLMDVDGEEVIGVSIGPWEGFNVPLPAEIADSQGDDLEVNLESITVDNQEIVAESYSVEQLSSVNKIKVEVECDSDEECKLLMLDYTNGNYQSASLSNGNEFEFYFKERGNVGIEDSKLDFIGITESGKVYSGNVAIY